MPSCCNGAKRLWLLGPGMIKLADPSPTLAEELKIEQNYFIGLILSENRFCQLAILTKQ
jgi:hypothetical protein